MKLHLQVVSVLCALLWPACFSSLVALNRKFDSENEEIVRIVPNVHSPTNFWALPSSSVAITAPTVPHEPTDAKNSLAKGMSTSESSESSSSSSQTWGVVTSTTISTTSSITFGPTSSSSSSSSSSSTKAPAMSTPHDHPGTPTATVSPPGSYTPSPIPVPTSTTAATTQSMQSTGCGPPITVTVNNGAHCTNTPSPPQACSSDCTSKIGLSLGISIPGTAILTFLVTALSCLCCQRVKKKHSYIQLAPTVYFDEEEHD